MWVGVWVVCDHAVWGFTGQVFQVRVSTILEQERDQLEPEVPDSNVERGVPGFGIDCPCVHAEVEQEPSDLHLAGFRGLAQ